MNLHNESIWLFLKISSVYWKECDNISIVGVRQFQEILSKQALVLILCLQIIKRETLCIIHTVCENRIQIGTDLHNQK